MLREYNSILKRAQKTWDIVLTGVSFITAYYLKKFYFPEPYLGMSTQPNYYVILLLSIIISYLVFEVIGFYRPYRKRTFFQIVIQIIKALTVNLFIIASFLFILKIQDVSRLFIFSFLSINFLLLVASNWLVYRFLTSIRKKGFNTRNIVIIGYNIKAMEILEFTKSRPESGYRVAGFVAVNGIFNDERIDNIPLLGGIDDLNDIIRRHVIDELIISEPLRKVENIEKHLYEAERMGIQVHILPEWGIHHIGLKPQIGRLEFSNLFGMPALSLITTPNQKPHIIFKYAFDYLVAGLGLLVFSIPMFLISLAVKCVSRGPVMFRQERVGMNGRRFTLYKFRTMVADAEEHRDELMLLNESDGPVFKIRKDPRVIPYVGTFLRKTSLDELPQLLNVLKGEMSLVGPRPPLPGEVDVYDIAQRRRLSMKPGLTCIWQIAPQRNSVSFADWIKMDLEYIDNWSLKLDFMILVKTVLAVLAVQGR